MKMIYAIVSNDDSHIVSSALTKAGFFATKIAVSYTHLTFRERRGLRRITNRKPLITMTVLEPVYSDTSKRARPEIERLLFECYEKMADFFDEHSMPVPQEQYPRAGSCESAAPLNQEETTDPALSLIHI